MKTKHGHERHPHHQQRREDTGDPRVEAAGVAVGAEERDELHDHDQRARRGLRQGEAPDHLAGRQPAVGLDGRLRDVGEHGVGAAEGHQRHAAEEDPLVHEDRLRPRRQDQRPAATGVTQSATPTPRIGRLRRHDGRAWCSASSGISGGRLVLRRRRVRGPRAAPGATGRPPSRRPRRRARRAGTARANSASARNAATASSDQRPVAQRTACRSGPPPGRRSPAPPARARGTARSRAVVSPWATYSTESASIASRPGSTNRTPAIRPPSQPLSSQPV